MEYFELANGEPDMVVTATDLKNNLGKYLEVAQEEDVLITRNGEPYATLSSVRRDRLGRMEALFGVLPEDVTIEDARRARFEAHGLWSDLDEAAN